MPKPVYRQLWMFPRNIRLIEPWKLVQISKILTLSDGDITDQSVQDGLYARLHDLGVKIAANEYGVSNSGGMRTYLAQLACLGFFWKDNKTHSYVPTRAGELLLNAENPLKLLRCQLLRMQYPSVYGLGQNVRISPSMRVKPFVFLVRLFLDARLEYHLSDLEIAVPVTYGRTDDDYERCVAKILEIRSGKSLRDVIDSVDDLRTPKRCNEKAPEEDWRKGLEDIHTIANTATNYLRAAQLLVSSSTMKGYYELNTDDAVLAEIEPWIEEPIEPIDKSTKEAWQQRFGRFDQQKAVRRSRAPQRAAGFESLVQSAFIEAVSRAPYGLDAAEFVQKESARWGRPAADIRLAIEPLVERRRTIEHDAVMKAAISGGKEAIVLELAATHIFRKVGFDRTEHCGQKYARRSGGYPDCYLRAEGWGRCGFADTKATSSYDMPLSDTLKLEAYYKDAWKEFPDPVESSFFLYVAGGFSRSAETVEAKLRDCSKKHGRPVSAITVSALLELAEMDNPPSREKLAAKFAEGRYFTSAAELAN